jgi:hypothetical protein
MEEADKADKELYRALVKQKHRASRLKAARRPVNNADQQEDLLPHLAMRDDDVEGMQ